MSDDVDDFFEKVKNFFNLDTDIFDIDVFLFPEAFRNKEIDLEDDDMQGFKVSYHFETGMDEPDVKIEGNLDEKKLNEYIKRYNPENREQIREFVRPNMSNEIDASELTLEDHSNEGYSDIIEPYTEINDFDEFTEVIIDIPGIKRDDISINYNIDCTILSFYAQKDDQTYNKDIQLPYKSSKDDTSIEINNGIIILKVSRSE